MAESIGETLLQARLARGETLEQVSLDLHIRPRYLEALECGNYEILPSEVQGKGFLRLYAGHLKLPVQPLLEKWGTRVDQPAAPELLQPIAPPPEEIPVETEEAAEDEATDELDLEYDETPAPEDTVQFDTSPADEPARPLPKSTDLFTQIGQQLKRQRLVLNLTLADVERHTHVRQRYLAALEEGQIENLPSPVQGRGMLSNYAGFLEMNVDALLLQFAEALQSRRIEYIAPKAGKKRSTTPHRPTKAPSWRRLVTPDLLVGSALILVLVGFAVWTASQVTALQRKNAEPTPPSLAQVLLQTGSPVPQASGSPTLLPNLGTRAPETGGGIAPLVSSTPGATITLPVGKIGPVQVQVIAKMQTYLRVTVDGKVQFDGRAIPGNAYSYGGNDRIEMLIGNAAALQIFYNQQDLGSPGFVGQVMSLIFSKDGVVTPTPMYPPTATRTQAPTSTLRPSPTLPTPTITPFIP
jgi:cytoskeleton protein RodZ